MFRFHDTVGVTRMSWPGPTIPRRSIGSPAVAIDPDASCEERVERHEVVDDEANGVVAVLHVSDRPGCEDRFAAADPDVGPVELEGR